MKREMSFSINNHKWTIKQKSKVEMLEIYQLIEPNATDCLGLTLRQFNTIYINDGLCEDEKIRTLKHELTHCFIWEMGFYYADFNNEEMICEFVATIHSFINYVMKKVGVDCDK